MNKIPSTAATPTRDPTNRVLIGLAIALIGVSLFLRADDLDRVPGINADEALIAILTMNIADGDFSRIWTGSGNVFNPIYHGTILLVHLVADPSPFVLRLPSLIFGVVSLLAAGCLLPLVVSRRVALIATLMLSVLPLHIAYSRISQGPSGTPLLALLCVFFAIRLDRIKTLVAFFLAIWVHPTNVFLFPILAAPLIDARIRAIRELEHADRAAALRRWLAAASVGLVAVALAIIAVNPQLIGVATQLLREAIGRAADPVSAIRFLALYGDLLSGSTIYTYFTGGDPNARIHAVVFWAVFIPVMLLGVRKLRRTGESRWLSMIIGLGVALLAFYLVGGIRAISPHYERWAAFLTVPSCLVFSVCLGSLGTNRRTRRLVAAVGLAIAIALLWSFRVHYFGGMRSYVGQHHTYRTGEVEPKLGALLTIEETRDRQRPTVIVAEDYWAYWPIRYLACSQAEIDVRVHMPQRYPQYQAQIGPLTPIPDDAEVFYVVFAGSELDRHLESLRTSVDRFEVGGFGDQPVLRIHRLRRTQPGG